MPSELNRIQFEIDQVYLDEISFWIRFNDVRIEHAGHEAFHDPFPYFAELINKVERGENARMEVQGDYSRTHLEIRVANTVDLNRIVVSIRGVPLKYGAHAFRDDVDGGSFEVEYDRDRFVEELSAFLRTLASHPDLSFQYLMFFEVEMDDIYDAAEAAWKEYIKDNEPPEDEYIRAEQDFECKFVRENAVIPDEIKEYADRYRDMLLSHNVPDGWVPKRGDSIGVW